MDIIVTTPKSEMANAAREAADCIRNGGGWYFRRFNPSMSPKVNRGDRVYYVQDGYVRGFAIVHNIKVVVGRPQRCDTTGTSWPPGFFVFMDSTTWQWITPIPMKGFQGFRYVHPRSLGERLAAQIQIAKLAGGWKDPRPANP